MQRLPYVVVTNPHISRVYDIYYRAFDTFRRVPEIRNVEDNDRYCKIIGKTLREHLVVIPELAKGVLKCQNLIRSEEVDEFMNTMLRSVCSPWLPVRCRG